MKLLNASMRRTLQFGSVAFLTSTIVACEQFIVSGCVDQQRFDRKRGNCGCADT